MQDNGFQVSSHGLWFLPTIIVSEFRNFLIPLGRSLGDTALPISSQTVHPIDGDSCNGDLLLTALSMDNNPLYFRAPRVPLWRRGCAFGFDSLIAWLLATLVGGPAITAQFIVFALTWFSIRVIVPTSYFGQSPGRWAFDMRVVSDRDNRTPLWQDFAKREAVSGIAVFLALVGFFNLGSRNAFYLILLLPLGVDVGVAWFDPVDPSAFHDRLSETRIVATRRGYSLDLKVKKWVALISRNVKQ